MKYTDYIGCTIHYETTSGQIISTTLDKCRAELLDEGILKIKHSTFKAFTEARFLDTSVLEKAFGKKVRKYKNFILVGKEKIPANTEVDITGM